MNTAIKTAMIGIAACAFAAPAFAYTLNGIVPPSPKPILIRPHNPGTHTRFLFRFYAPASTATLDFCIGPGSNPCASATSIDVKVFPTQQQLLFEDVSVFAHNILVVKQNTNKPVPYVVTVEYAN
jgi:hypothetical protein